MGFVVHAPQRGSTWRHYGDDPQVRLALVTAVCLVVEAVLAKNVLDVELRVLAQFAPLYVFTASLVSGLRDRRSELSFTVAIVATSAAVLLLYAL